MSLPFFSKQPKARLVLQSEQQECGLACMAMIANAHGHNIDLPYMRSVHQIQRGGMTFAELYNLGGLMGFDPRGLAVQNIDDLKALKLPAILHWEGRHYVVLSSISGGRYTIFDPAIGRRVYNQKDFSRYFSGVAMEFEPRISMEKIVSHDDGLRLIDVIRATNGFSGSFWKIMAISVAVGILTLATPILLQVSLDFVLPQADIDLLAIIAIGLCALLMFEGVGSWLRDIVILRTSIGMQLQFSRSVVGHGLRLPLRYFEARHPGDFVTRLNSIDQVKAFAADGLVRSIADASVSLISVALMFYYSTQMTMMVLGTLAVALAIRVLYIRKTRDATAEALQAKSDEVSTMLDGLDRIQTIKVHNVSKRYEQRWYEKLAIYASSDFFARSLQINAQLFMHLVVVVGTVVTLYAGVAEVIQNKMTIGMLYAFFALRGQFFAMADTLTANLMHLSVISSHLRRLEDVIQQEPEATAKTAMIQRYIRKNIELKDITISFGLEERPVVSSANLHIDIDGNEHIAIVGESGSGKSSLLKVLASTAKPSTGSFLIDGQPLSRFGLMEYRSNIGAVFAEDGLFTATVAENVSLFDPDISVAQIIEALEAVGLEAEVDALPQGLATPVANNFSLLSTGQRRRLLAARVICRRPRLMLFDEITANLDAQTERHLLARICGMPGAKVFVTHSDRLLEFVDRAYRMQDGVLTPMEIRPPANRRDQGIVTGRVGLSIQERVAIAMKKAASPTVAHSDDRNSST